MKVDAREAVRWKDGATLAIQKGLLVLLILPGIVAGVQLLRVWLEAWGQQALFIWLPLGAVLAFSLGQCAISWFLYLRFGRREVPPAPHGLSVDLFVTACREPLWLVERTLAAAVRVRYPHVTYLLDDGREPALAKAAQRLGAEYLTREGNRDHKAGNINAALARTRGEFVGIFDVDHVPAPDFLDRTLAFFADAGLGFVQAMVTFSNTRENLLAEASAQTSYEYYNLSAVGKDRCGGAGLMGSNAVIRRSALASIGGYQAGLAEDLETSLALHSTGWRSAYVCEPLAPGLTPASFAGFAKQQLKWSRGVFGAALRSLRGPFFRLSLTQKMCYGLRFSNYLAGVMFFLNMWVVAAALFWPALSIERVLFPWIPLVLTALVIRFYGLRVWATDPEARRGFLFKGLSLVLSAWPFYVVAFVSTLARVRVPFIPTPKTAGWPIRTWLLLPQATMTSLLTVAVSWRLLHWAEAPMPVTLAFGLVDIGAHWILIPVWLQGRLGRREPSGDVEARGAGAAGK